MWVQIFFSPPLSYHIKKKLHSNSSTPCPAGSTLQSTTARIQFHTPAVEESTAQMSLSASTQILRFSHRRHNSGITATMYTPGPFWKTNRHTKSSKVRMSYRKILTQEALESAFTGPKYIWIHTSVVSEPWFSVLTVLLHWNNRTVTPWWDKCCREKFTTCYSFVTILLNVNLLLFTLNRHILQMYTDM